MPLPVVAAIVIFLTTALVASACDGTETGSVGRSTLPDGAVVNVTGGAHSTGGATGSGGRLGSGGTSAAGGFTGCPPCAAPPPNCVGTGPCGCGYICPEAGAAGLCGGQHCGVGTSCCAPPECGHCVPDTSGVFCPDYCDYCSGKYQRLAHSTVCSGTQSVQWEVTNTDLAPFAVPECRDLGTNLPRYCCTPAFKPACP